MYRYHLYNLYYIYIYIMYIVHTAEENENEKINKKVDRRTFKCAHTTRRDIFYSAAAPSPWRPLVSPTLDRVINIQALLYRYRSLTPTAAAPDAHNII